MVSGFDNHETPIDVVQDLHGNEGSWYQDAKLIVIKKASQFPSR